MSHTQIIIALTAGLSLVIISGCLILIVVVRLRHVVKSQLETLDSLVSTLRAGQDRDKPGPPS